MKRILPCIVLWSFGLAVSATNIQTGVDKLINQVDPATNIGIEVVDLNTGESIYQRNATRAFIPASNMKLFSDAAAIMALGPDYHFQSQLSTNASVLDGGVLKGSIYLHLPGDPSLTKVHLESLLSQLAPWGIKQIQGNVVLVSSNSLVNAYAPGWVAKDLKYSYGAPLAPVMLDENRLMVTVNPAANVGQAALVEFDDESGSMMLDNQLKTTAKIGNCGVDISMNQDNTLTVRGCVAVGQWAVQQRIAIRNPLKYMQELVKQQLSDLHIQLRGQVVLGNAPSSSLLLATHDSKPISQLLADTLKPSDNLYADSLFLHAAAKLNGSPLNWQAAQHVVKNFLQKQTNINLQNAVLTDGSGLSRQDLLTPQQTVGLLRFLHDRFPLSYEYIAALPVAGHDGTLQRRLRMPSQQGLVRAKTGTMTGVIGLSGYLYTANAHTLAFAIFINKLPGTSLAASGKYRYLVDALCNFLLHQKPEGSRFAGSKNPFARLAFQMHPTQSDLQRSKKAKWRHLEATLKQVLRGRQVNVLFRGDELILNDHEPDINKVWAALQGLRKRYSFAVALQSKAAPAGNITTPFLLWVKTANIGASGVRTWTVRESV